MIQIFYKTKILRLLLFLCTKNELKKENIKKIYATNEQITSHGQGALAFLLHFDVLEGEAAEAVAKTLDELVKKDGYVHKVGILGMKALPNALSKYGYNDTALKLLTRTDYPSYGHWRSLGETTLCEKWENVSSRNHHMYSDVINWMIRNIAGLQKMTLLDFPGKVACTVFLQGCNFRCPFCHNAVLVLCPDAEEGYKEEEIIEDEELESVEDKLNNMDDDSIDTGIDDAVALMMAVKSDKFDIRLI